MPRRSIVIFAAIVLALAAGLGGYALMNRQLPGHLSTGTALVGGPFTLTDQNGRKVSEKDFLGRYMLVFFGFTYCPDICPTELQVMTAALDAMGPGAEKIQPVFITIDPERDTPDALAGYVSNFDPRIIGLTGPADEVAQAAADFRATYRRVDKEGGDYTMDHTAGVFLFHPDGSFASIIDFHEDRRFAVPKLRRTLS